MCGSPSSASEQKTRMDFGLVSVTSPSGGSPSVSFAKQKKDSKVEEEEESL